MESLLRTARRCHGFSLAWLRMNGPRNAGMPLYWRIRSAGRGETGIKLPLTGQCDNSPLKPALFFIPRHTHERTLVSKWKAHSREACSYSRTGYSPQGSAGVQSYLVRRDAKKAVEQFRLEQTFSYPSWLYGDRVKKGKIKCPT
jgi:hypothetical protein